MLVESGGSGYRLQAAGSDSYGSEAEAGAQDTFDDAFVGRRLRVWFVSEEDRGGGKGKNVVLGWAVVSGGRKNSSNKFPKNFRKTSNIRFEAAPGPIGPSFRDGPFSEAVKP